MIFCFNFRLMLLLSVVFISGNWSYGQQNSKQALLDSLNKTREQDLGAFNVYASKSKIEFIGGAYRNRTSVS